MSVLIKGMKMPKSCRHCNLYRPYEPMTVVYCGACGRDHNYGEGEKSRPDWCPLVEVPAKHGNLIDSSQVMDVNMYDEQYEEWFLKSMTIANLLCDWCDNEAKTIIEAETNDERNE